MGEHLLKRIQDSGAEVEVTKISKPCSYDVVVGTTSEGDIADVVCDMTAVMSLELHVRHGSTLLLRNI